MVQLARPIADISDGSWTTDSGGTSLFAAIDEATASDADYIQSSGDASDDAVEVALSAISDPGIIDTGHILRWRMSKDGPATMHATVQLVEGSTVRAERVYFDIPDTATDYSFTLTTGQIGEATAISDYGNLRVRIIKHRADAYSWSDLGTDSVIAAETTSLARKIRSVTKFDGVYVLGYGDINSAISPIYVRYYDPSDSTFKTHPGLVGGQQSEAITPYHLFDGVLWGPYNDTTSTPDFVTLTSKSAGSTLSKLGGVLVHGWQMAKHGSDLFLAGSKSSGTEPTVWRSIDSGATWAVAFSPTDAGMHWCPCVFSVGGFVWTMPYGGIPATAHAYKSADGASWSDAGFTISPNGYPPRRAVSFASKVYYQATSPDGATRGFLHVFDGTGTATDITASVGGYKVDDLIVAGGALYVLVNGNQVWRSTDGATFTRIAYLDLPTAATGLCVDGTDLYIGSAGSHLYKGVLS